MAAVRRFEDFDYWKLANELKLAIYELSERADVKPDRDVHRAFGPDPRTFGLDLRTVAPSPLRTASGLTSLPTSDGGDS